MRCATLLVACLLSSGCAGDTDIIGECRVATDATRVASGGAPSVGRLGLNTLVSWHVTTPEGATSMPPYSTELARNLTQSLEPSGGLLTIGRVFVRPARTRWVSGEDLRVHGQVWLQQPADFGTDPNDTSRAWLAAIAADDGAVALTQLNPPDWLRLGGANLDSGPGPLPVASSGGTLAVYGAVPEVCSTDYSNYSRLFLERPPAAPKVVRWTEDICGSTTEEATELESSNPWLFELPDGDIGLLFRLHGPTSAYLTDGELPGAVHYLRLSAGGELRFDPIRVGSAPETTTDDGYLPRGVALPGNRVLFSEREGPNNVCHLLRVMNDDGTDVRDAPWQLPCHHDLHRDLGRGELPRLTSDVELLPIEGGAVLIYSERVGDRTYFFDPDDDRYEEGVYAVVLTPDGRRGSEILEVTDPEASTITIALDESGNPVTAWPNRFLPHAANDGADITVAWQDLRGVAPGAGVYARRIECTVQKP